jgi:membrane protease YdiL (CAAX protease family)
MARKKQKDKAIKEEKEIEKELGEIEDILGKINTHRKKIDDMGEGKKTSLKESKEIEEERTEISRRWGEINRWLQKRSSKQKHHESANRMKASLLYTTYTLLMLAEVILLYNLTWGLITHATILFGLAITSGIIHKHKKTKDYQNASNLLKALMLLPLVRIFGFTLPLVYFRQIYWPLIVGIPLVIAVTVLSRNLKLTMKDIGLTYGRIQIQLPVALLGIAFGFMEYTLIKPKPWINTLTPEDLIAPALILMIFTGLTEELIFRGIIQTMSTRLFGAVNGIIYSGILFTTMHIAFNSLPHMIFVLTIAIFYGSIYHKTKTLSGIMLSHGTSNIILYLIAPFIL